MTRYKDIRSRPLPTRPRIAVESFILADFWRALFSPFPFSLCTYIYHPFPPVSLFTATSRAPPAGLRLSACNLPQWRFRCHQFVRTRALGESLTPPSSSPLLLDSADDLQSPWLTSPRCRFCCCVSPFLTIAEPLLMLSHIHALFIGVRVIVLYSHRFYAVSKEFSARNLYVILVQLSN